MKRVDGMRRVLGSLVVMAVTIAAAQGAEEHPRKKASRPSAAAPSQYKLDLSTALNASNAPAPPPGTSTLAEERKLPFLGLKLSTPLGD